MLITRHAWEPPDETLRKVLFAWLESLELPEIDGATLEHDVKQIFPDRKIDCDYRIVMRRAGDLAQGKFVSNRLFYPLYHVSFFSSNENLAQMVASWWGLQKIPGATMQWSHMGGLQYDAKSNMYFIKLQLQLHRKFCKPKGCFDYGKSTKAIVAAAQPY